MHIAIAGLKCKMISLYYISYQFARRMIKTTSTMAENFDENNASVKKDCSKRTENNFDRAQTAAAQRALNAADKV